MGGLQRLGDAVIVFDVHDDGHELPNLPLVNLAPDITDVVRPLLRPTELLPADVRDRGN
jgi:hypothetical protein